MLGLAGNLAFGRPPDGASGAWSATGSPSIWKKSALDGLALDAGKVELLGEVSWRGAALLRGLIFVAALRGVEDELDAEGDGEGLR